MSSEGVKWCASEGQGGMEVHGAAGGEQHFTCLPLCPDSSKIEHWQMVGAWWGRCRGEKLAQQVAIMAPGTKTDRQSKIWRDPGHLETRWLDLLALLRGMKGEKWNSGVGMDFLGAKW